MAVRPRHMARIGPLAENPYMNDDIWKDITIFAGRVAPLPYRPLQGAQG
jgi:hypothetical protein